MSVTVYVKAHEGTTQTIQIPQGAKVRHDAPAFHDDGTVRVDDAAGKRVAFFSVANIVGIVVNSSD